MSKYPVSEVKARQLEDRMRELGIRESDLLETFVRSRGAGGQNVNKVSTCVMLRHALSGESVKCQRERTRAMNRYWARRLLCEKIERRIQGRQSAEAMRVAKIRRQKRRRSKRAKDKMLDFKKRQGQKKQLRGKIHPEQF